MEWTEVISLALNLVLSGGLIVTLYTLKAQKRKAEAEADNEELTSAGSIMEMQVKYIVEPIKKEVNALRKDVRKLQKAIEKIDDCTYRDNCPVRHQLRDEEASSQGRECGTDGNKDRS